LWDKHKSITAIKTKQISMHKFKLQTKLQVYHSNKKMEGNNNTHILVQWKGMNMSNNTWGEWLDANELNTLLGMGPFLLLEIPL
jgi:hypothetical protein